jgi:glycosyltransferase involved in cell wall biosynthesis
MPSLSLCIPAYNASGHLPRLLRSAQQQTEAFDEILVYDDCSTDNTAEVARSHGAKVVSGDENQGCAVGRKRLAEHATSDWIHFHDADDKLLPSFVERAREWMRKDNPPDVVLFGYEHRRLKDEKLIKKRVYDGNRIKKYPIKYTIKNHINPNSGIYKRKEFLEAGGPDTDPKVLYNEDYAMHCKLAREGLCFDADPEAVSVYYQREGSMSRGNITKCRRARYYVLEKCARNNGQEHGGVIAEKLWELAGSLAADLQWDLADKSAQLAVKLDGRIPSTEGPIFRVLAAIHPQMALRLRENVIRLIWPQWRASHR